MKRSIVIASILILSSAPLATAQAPDPGGTVALRAQFSIRDHTGDPVDVVLGYGGTTLRGNALATYTFPDGKIIRDEMRDCVLTDSNGIWKIDCKNPHYTSVDGLYFHVYGASSGQFTNGLLKHFDIIGSVDVQVRYSPFVRE